MSETSKHSVRMPASRTVAEPTDLLLKDRVLVVIGANGSGKTRFGAWLESQAATLHHRVSAHRSLVFPERVQPMDLQEAEAILFNGTTSKNDPGHQRLHNRWQNRPAVALLNDFEPLVTLMVSESFTVSDSYRVAMQSESRYRTPPITRLDLVKQIWESVLPARELRISGNRIETANRQDTKPYHAKEMSDGERGVFYLIGEALSVPQDGVFIVDEPELHLHRAIQARLWDAIESARPDCTFIYITHDLGFAASRKDATKVWLREYTDGKWDWEVVPEIDAFPETLLLEVIGSRRPILFIEGDSSSLDYFIYGRVFPDLTVVPCGSCELVVHSARSFTSMHNLHHNKCFGLVDNDGRSTSDIEMLNRLGIAVLPVAIIENLFLLESILRLAAQRLGHDPAETVQKIKARVFAKLGEMRVRVVSDLTRQEIETGLRLFGKGGDGSSALTAAFKNACDAIDPAVIYEKWDQEIASVLEDEDYAAALRYYKIKGLVAEAGSVFGMKYQDQLLRWLRSKDAEDLLTAFRVAIPQCAVGGQ